MATNVASDTVHIAVVQDGASWFHDQLLEQVQAELDALLTGRDVRWIEQPEWNAQWDADHLATHLRLALDEPQTDLVFALGTLTTILVARQSTTLTKPVVGGMVPEATILDLPIDADGFSTQRNLTFVANPRRIKDDIQSFHRLTGFSHLHVFMDRGMLQGLPPMEILTQRMDAHLPEPLTTQADPRISILPMDDQAGPVLDSLPETTQAVYLSPALRMSEKQRDALLQGLIARKIPTFSLLGRPDVEQGVLAGLAPGNMGRFARRIALNIQQVLLGQEARSLPVLLQEEDALVINARTAEQIGFSPTFTTWIEATWLDRPSLGDAPPLTLAQAMLLALEHNAGLDAERFRRDAARRDHDLAGSRMLPQAVGQVQYQRLDADRAQASLGLFPRERTTAGIVLRQMIFDDALISAWRATDHLSRSRSRELESVRLDVLAEAGQRYLQLLSAQAMLRIDREVLQLTQTHRQMARTRHQIGVSGPEDVYRWESETAQRKSAVFAAQTLVEQARFALNQTLGMDQDQQWAVQDILLGDDDFAFLDKQLNGLLRTVADWERLRPFFVELAQDLSPEIKALDEVTKAQEIDRDRLRRRFTTPSLHAQFSYDRELAADRPGAGGLPFSLPEADRNEWTVGLALSMPLFEGGGRFHELRQAEDQLQGLARTRNQAKQLVAQRVRTALVAMQSSHPNIRLTREAARLSRENLRVVQDKYARGVVTILDLLDAQNQVAVQEQAAALAVYMYLGDLLECQRALAWFEVDKTDAEKQAFLDAMQMHLMTGN
ncbi:TolC family protein [Desulfonatronum thioautotrophicum]|uniref:TolC family protein n=1 Tax=Desulfonatronum thioautotrophicum TaxID=617001 RepID=UPI0013792670|nr:TolC family protein [Desulfonatronum thioautotrophicum]